MISSIVRSFFIVGELDKSADDLVEEWLDAASRTSNLSKRENRERVLQQIFASFDADRNGTLDLQVSETKTSCLLVASSSWFSETLRSSTICSKPCGKVLLTKPALERYFQTLQLYHSSSLCDATNSAARPISQMW